MVIWGSSYFLHDTEPVRLIGTIGASTDRSDLGSVVMSFAHQPDVFFAVHRGSKWELSVKWDVALRMVAIIHVLVVQNRLLRGESAELAFRPGQSPVFAVTGGAKRGPIVCNWEANTVGVECRPVEGMPEQMDLTLREDLATQLVTAFADRIARNRIASAPAAPKSPC